MDEINKFIEVNGPANIIMLLEAYGNNLTDDQVKALKAEAVKTIAYLRNLANPAKVRWSEIKE